MFLLPLYRLIMAKNKKPASPAIKQTEILGEVQPQTHITTEFSLVEHTHIEYSFFPSNDYQMFLDGVTELNMFDGEKTTICKVVYPKEFHQRKMEEEVDLLKEDIKDQVEKDFEKFNESTK